MARRIVNFECKPVPFKALVVVEVGRDPRLLVDVSAKDLYWGVKL